MAYPNDRYWYVANNGNGTWGNNSTGQWWYGTGGTLGQAPVPSSSNDVYFDANSGSGTVSIASPGGLPRECANLIMTGFTGVIQSGYLRIFGSSVILPATGVFDPGDNPVLYFYSGTTTHITSNGQSIGSIQIQAGTTAVLVDNFQMHNNSTLTIDLGTFDANNKNVSVGAFTDTNSSLNSKILNMGSGTWTITGATDYNAATSYFWNVYQPSKLTINPSTSKLRFLRAKDSIGLAADVTSTIQMTVTVRDITWTTNNTWPIAGKILIDGEKMTYFGVSNSTANKNNITLTITARGVDNTVAATHTTGAIVFLITPLYTTLTSAIPNNTSTSALNVISYSATGSILTSYIDQYTSGSDNYYGYDTIGIIGGDVGGSVSINSINGKTLKTFGEKQRIGISNELKVAISGFASNPGSNWLSSVSVAGQSTYYASDASYSYNTSLGIAIWIWTRDPYTQGRFYVWDDGFGNAAILSISIVASSGGSIDILPTNGFEFIDGEIISWNGKTTSTLGSTSVSRGYNGTTATYHASGSIVRHCEKTGFNGGGLTYNIIEFNGSMEEYMETTITGGFTATTITSDGHGIRYLKFDGSAYNITNFNLSGTHAQPIYVSGLASTNKGYNVEYISSTVPSLPYVDTRKGNFIDLIL